MKSSLLFYGATALALACCSSGNAQKLAVLPTTAPLTYVDVADLADKAAITAQIRIAAVQQIKPTALIFVPPGKKRYLVTATVTALIRGADGLPPQIRYLVDVPVDARGKPPKLKKTEAMIFALPVPGRPSEIQLVAPDAQLVLTAALATQVRSILTAMTSSDAPPRILGVGDAFHVAGSLTGQGETQIFLQSGDGRPVSLSIWREPGLATRWAVSLGEIVDEGGGPPPRNTLLWYRLACFLPASLPLASRESVEPAYADIAAEDYATVIAGLGKCPRNRQP